MIKKFFVFLILTNTVFGASYLSVHANQSSVIVGNKIKINGSTDSFLDIGIQINDPYGYVVFVDQKPPQYYETIFIPTTQGTFTVYVSSGGLTNTTTFVAEAATSTTSTTSSTSSSSSSTSSALTTSEGENQNEQTTSSSTTSSTTTTSSITTTVVITLTVNKEEKIPLNYTLDYIKFMLSEEHVKKVIKKLFGADDNVFISRLSVMGQEIIDDIVVKRKLETGNTTKLWLFIHYKGNQTVYNFSIYDRIPKEFAQNASEITVNTTGKVAVIRDDPSFLILFSTVRAGEQKNIVYIVKKQVDNISIGVPVIFAEKISSEASPEYVCGDGLCEEGEICPIDCQQKEAPNFYWIIIFAILITIVIVATYYLKPTKPKYRVKPTKTKYRYKKSLIEKIKNLFKK